MSDPESGAAALAIRGVRKRFGDHEALRGVDLELRPGELFTLLGPSGCGKTTLLRVVAGFAAADAGEVRLGAEDLLALPAHKRDVGLVFQSYALFPHLDVTENVAFGLVERGVSASERDERVRAALKRVQLEELAEREPGELSGGQQQRVAIARALVIEPRLLLMDEPLSNLDAKLRLAMREEIRALQQASGTTTLYVTHDQEEALAISDRLAVLSAGQVEQVGTPWEVYREPRTTFVAEFVGQISWLAPDADPLLAERAPAGAAKLGVRPEELRLHAEQPEGPALTGTLRELSFTGPRLRARVAAAGTELLVDEHAPDPGRWGLAGGAGQLAPGAEVWVELPAAPHAYDGAGQRLESGGG